FALAQGARAGGAKAIRHCRATNVKQLPGGEWRVSTDHGDIDCEIVVNAGGAYARQIGRWSGLDLPITCMTHHYLVTDTVPEFLTLDRELPVVRDDRLVSGYIRMEQKSGLIGIYEKANPNTVWLDGAPWEAEHELFDPDYERIMTWLENAMDRMPVLADLGIKREVHGAITHPPDGNPLCGPAPGLRNYWCCCGVQIGLGWGPGLGKYLAQWMARGAADINMRDFDPRRYGSFANFDYAVTKAKEDYLLRHEIPYPHFNRTASRPNKTSPLYERLKENGAVYEEVFGWERPRWFASNGMAQEDVHSFRRTPVFDAVAREVRAVRETAGIMDLSPFAKVEVSGTDAEAFVNRMIANRAPAKAGRMVLTHILNPRGTIESETMVIRLEGGVFYFVFAAFHELRVMDWLMQHRPADEDVVIANVSQKIGTLALQGPAARDILRQVTQTPLDNGNFPWFSAQDIEIAGHGVRALRMSYAGELGWELHLPMRHVADVYDALWQTGQAFGLQNYGSYAMNAMRLEKMFKGASELTTEVTLAEADVMRLVKLDDHGFIGKEATARSAVNGLRWICAYLEIEDTVTDCHGSEAVLANGARIGAVSSGAYGHATGKSLAFAYIDPEYAGAGTALEVSVLGERRPARVLAEAVYDPGNQRPRM
ncbi:MAG: FAD-dependent oxidoreductase, partial [Gammaproteobacteria bacterium]